MAFRLLDFGIPDFDTNVNVLYKQAIEKGTSYFIGEKEYVVYDAGAKLVLVFCFEFAEDGETPVNVTAHTFLNNEVRWQGKVQATAEGAFFSDDTKKLPVEVIHALEDDIITWIPMLYVDAMDFSKNESVFAQVESDIVALGDGVRLVARIGKITPIIISQLWVYSIVEVIVGRQRLYCPVPREKLEEQLSACSEGVWCEIHGHLSLMKDWMM